MFSPTCTGTPPQTSGSAAVPSRSVAAAGGCAVPAVASLLLTFLEKQRGQEQDRWKCLSSGCFVLADLVHREACLFGVDAVLWASLACVLDSTSLVLIQLLVFA